MTRPLATPGLRRSARRHATTPAAVVKKLEIADEGLPVGAQQPAERTRGSRSLDRQAAKRIKTETKTETKHEIEQENKPEIKTEPESTSPQSSAQIKRPGQVSKAEALRERKLKSFSAFCKQSPFPDFARPTREECRLAHEILAQIHGDRRRRPGPVVAAPTDSAGCGDSPSVLDALVRTILSQNTSNKNSTRAKLSMDAEYGGSDQWEAIVDGGQAKLERSIQSGGLAAIKSRVIINLLRQTKDRYGRYSLDHLFQASDDDAMKEMIGFQGVGPKTASCVLLFCLQRPSFAVDTHVHRITGLLGWRPKTANRQDTQAHLEVMVPDEEKYPLHVLLVNHGRLCAECKAGGSKSARDCALRKAFPARRPPPPPPPPPSLPGREMGKEAKS